MKKSCNEHYPHSATTDYHECALARYRLLSYPHLSLDDAAVFREKVVPLVVGFHVVQYADLVEPLQAIPDEVGFELQIVTLKVAEHFLGHVVRGDLTFVPGDEYIDYFRVELVNRELSPFRFFFRMLYMR